MKVGIGLPSTIPGVGRASLLDWASRAEARGFSTLGTIDRLVYSNYESLIALAAAAAVTERIRLTTDILLVPMRANAALLAKQAATIDSLSQGRLTLGVAPGAREDDYAASGVDFGGRGRLMDEMLREMKAVWEGAERGFAGRIGPPPSREGGPELVIGGKADAAFRRVGELGDGWTMGGGAPDDFEAGVRRTREAWQKAGRAGEPRLITLCYFGLGPGAREVADEDLRDYYAVAGEDVAGRIVASAAIDAEMVTSYRDAFAAAGADELIYFPTSTDPAQVDLLADAVL